MDKNSGGIDWRPMGLDKKFAVSFTCRSTMQVTGFATRDEATDAFMAKGRNPDFDNVALHVRPERFNHGTAASTLRGDDAAAWLGRAI